MMQDLGLISARTQKRSSQPNWQSQQTGDETETLACSLCTVESEKNLLHTNPRVFAGSHISFTTTQCTHGSDL
jgi:hypothetical protein